MKSFSILHEWAGLPPARAWVSARAIETLHGCKFPIGDPSKAGFHFCNRKRRVGPYCAEHDALCHGVVPWKLDLRDAWK